MIKKQSVPRTHRDNVAALDSNIRAALVGLGDQNTKKSLERYFRGVVVFHGVKTPILNSFYRELASRIRELSTPDCLRLAKTLLKSPYAEEKGIAIRILHTFRTELGVDFLSQFEPEFRAHVYDWGTADTLSGKVFRHLIERGDKSATRQIVSWRNDSSLWMQRMAAVSFVWLARHGQVTEEVLRVCKRTVKNPERFTQLGTGWVLRELWLAEPKRVETFITEHYHYFSREGLRYAIEKMPIDVRKYFSNSSAFKKDVHPCFD